MARVRANLSGSGGGGGVPSIEYLEHGKITQSSSSFYTFLDDYDAVLLIEEASGETDSFHTRFTLHGNLMPASYDGEILYVGSAKTFSGSTYLNYGIIPNVKSGDILGVSSGAGSFTAQTWGVKLN